VPSSVPKYTRWSTTIGEDSERLGSSFDHETLPLLAQIAATLPGLPFVRSRIVTTIFLSP